MFFFISKTLTFLLMPLTWILIAALIALLSKQKFWKYLTFFLILFFSNPFLAHQAMEFWQTPPKTIQTLAKYKIGIVLTGVTMEYEPKDRVYFNKGADRIWHTYLLYKEKKIEKILITGAYSKKETESESSKLQTFLLEVGVPKEDIWIENRAVNTYQNAIFSKELLDKKNLSLEKHLLISSAFHLPRAIACFQKAGLTVESFSTDFYTEKPYHLSFRKALFPSVQALSQWNTLSKEIFGYMVYAVLGYL